MASTFLNLLSTILLTLICSGILVLTYRFAVRPILIRHNVIPLRHLPSTISQHFANRRNGIRLSFDDDAMQRDLESAIDEEYHDDPEEQEEAVGRSRYTDEPEGPERDAREMPDGMPAERIK